MRNKRSAARHDDADPSLNEAAEAKPPHPSLAQERQKRKLGDTDEDDDDAHGVAVLPSAATWSSRARRRLLDESMDLEPTV